MSTTKSFTISLFNKAHKLFKVCQDTDLGISLINKNYLSQNFLSVKVLSNPHNINIYIYRINNTPILSTLYTIILLSYIFFSKILASPDKVSSISPIECTIYIIRKLPVRIIISIDIIYPYKINIEFGDPDILYIYNQKVLLSNSKKPILKE